MSLSGKGNSASETSSTTNVSNQQVATESGIAVGAGSSASISVTSSDPGVVKEALRANAATSGSAFTFAGHAAEIAAQTNALATRSVENIAGTSILAQNALATKYTEHVSENAAQNINLLQSVAQQGTDIALSGQKLAGDALDKSFAVSRAVAPQDANYSSTETTKYYVYGAVAIAVIFLGMLFLRGKRS